MGANLVEDTDLAFNQRRNGLRALRPNPLWRESHFESVALQKSATHARVSAGSVRGQLGPESPVMCARLVGSVKVITQRGSVETSQSD